MGVKVVILFKYYTSISFGVAPTFNLTTNTTWFFSLNNEIVFSSPDQVPFLLTIPELLSVEQNPADGGVFFVYYKNINKTKTPTCIRKWGFKYKFETFTSSHLM